MKHDSFYLMQFELTLHVNCPYKKWLKQRRKPLFQQAALDTITLEHGSIVTLVIFLKHLYVSTLTHL